MRLKILLFVVALVLPLFASAESSLIRLSPGTTRNAVVLVGGRANNYLYWKEQIEDFKSQGYQVFGWSRDTASSTMTESAEDLVNDLQAVTSGVSELTVMAHSMGGLVAHRALLDYSERYPDVVIKFVAAGTPWGGYFMGDLGTLPFADKVIRWLKLPMGPEIGTHSAFMQSLQAEFPSNVTFTIIQSDRDTIASPMFSPAVNQYLKVLQHADQIIDVDCEHDGYNSALKELKFNP